MFPDIANVLHIREALWRHKILGNASVMIGAGFSRNAEPLSSAARTMPNWSEMAKALCHPLYPTIDSQQERALGEANGTSGFLRLAQEFQSAFGASSLNDKIRGLVPDLDYRPGDLHKRLLRLPWADVFSTNWDTLLERACTDVFDRSYDVVRTIGEIPFAVRPRIVKLHGTFPGHEPFIFTEEEYRTYPSQFSAFVNLVQQSMMETIFCLLGFSGDDPNFLHWSGWVRDNLGQGAPKIYLVGWLKLSNHRRRMLEARNVMPVDLSALPQAALWPAHLRHRYATEWFIAALEQGKPYSAAAWPSPPKRRPVSPSHLGDVPDNYTPTTTDVSYPVFDKPNADRLAALKKLIDAWAHNRRLYPGWLVAPERSRKTLQRTLIEWWSEFLLLSELSTFDQLKSLSELAWATDCAMLFFPSELEQLALGAIAAVDRLSQTVGGQKIPKEENWDEISRGSDMLALILARNGRHAGDHELFTRALGHLKTIELHDAECRNAIIYEECLWDLGNGDLPSLSARLGAWLPEQGEAVWSLRKAGLLAELGEDARACAIVEAALMQVRRTRRRDIDDIPSLSLEGWALFLALPYSPRGFAWRSVPLLPEDLPEPFERWRALGVVDCDAYEEYQALRKALEGGPARTSELTKRRGFDLDRIHTTHHFGDGLAPANIAACEMVILAERTGLPPFAGHYKLFDDGLKDAAKLLANEAPVLAGQILLRAGRKDVLLDDVISRSWIAQISTDAVEAIRRAASNRVAFGLSQTNLAENRGRNGVALLGVALEVLSRVAVRLSTNELLRIFGDVVGYYRTPRVWPKGFEVRRRLANLMRRVLESLPRSDLSSLLLQLFELPLPRATNLANDNFYLDDLFDLLPSWFLKGNGVSVARGPNWKEVVDRLIVAASGSDSVDRAAAIQRLFLLHQWKALDPTEVDRFAGAVWSSQALGRFGLPINIGLRAWVLLLLPEERASQARDALLGAIDASAVYEEEKLSVRLAGIGEILQNLKRQNVSFEIKKEVKVTLTKLVESWAAEPSPKTDSIAARVRFSFDQERIDEAIAGVAAIVQNIDITDTLLLAIWSKVDDMERSGDPHLLGFPLYPVLSRHTPNRSNELIERLRRALLSDEEDRVNVAVRGLLSWIANYSEVAGELKDGLQSLVREVGIGIAARRHAILPGALLLARWIFREGPIELRSLIFADCDHGLIALADEAIYSRPSTLMDVPSIRARCFRLAVAMAGAGFSELRGVVAWIENAKDDPLPEVRNANESKDD